MVRIHSSSEVSHENLSRLDTSKKGKIFEISSSCGIWPKQRRGLSTNSQARDITRSDLSNGGGSLGGLARPTAACGGAAVLRPTCPDLSPVLNEDYFPAGANHSDSKTPPILFNQQHRNPQTADRQGQRRQTPRKPCILRIPVNDRQIHQGTRHRRQHDALTCQPGLHLPVTHQVRGCRRRARATDQPAQHTHPQESQLPEVPLAKCRYYLNQHKQPREAQHPL